MPLADVADLVGPRREGLAVLFLRTRDEVDGVEAEGGVAAAENAGRSAGGRVRAAEVLEGVVVRLLIYLVLVLLFDDWSC